MSKEVIYLEPDEEITSIIDKLKSLEHTKTVFLVTPKSANINQSVVNLKILKKEADNLAMDIAIVTPDVVGRNLATQVGIPIYETINSMHPLIEPAKEEPNVNDIIEIDMTEKTSPKPPPGVKVNYYNPQDENPVVSHPNHHQAKQEPVTHSMVSPISMDRYQSPQFSRPKVAKKWLPKLIIFLVLIITGFTLFYLYYPKATVNIIVKSEPVSEKIEISVDTSAKTTSSDGKTIPGEIIRAEKETTKEFNATGKKDIGEKAKGKVTFSNGAGTVTDLKSGTQIEANGLVFVTTENISIPAATASVDAGGNVVKNPGTKEGAVEALQAGEPYNISATDFSVVNHSNISAASHNSFSGGTTKQLTVISQKDLDDAQETLKKEIKEQLKIDLANNASGKKYNIVADGIEYRDGSFVADKQAGAETDKFSANMKINAQTIAFYENDYRNAVVKALGVKIPSNKELVLSTNDQIEQGNFSTDFSKGTLKIDGTIKTKLAPKINDEDIKNSIKGQSLLSAENTLRQNTNIASYNIKSNVNWIKKIPSKNGNIIINKTYQNN